VHESTCGVWFHNCFGECKASLVGFSHLRVSDELLPFFIFCCNHKFVEEIFMVICGCFVNVLKCLLYLPEVGLNGLPVVFVSTCYA